MVLFLAMCLQVGWATIHCPFTAEEGVGDAPDSYAVDGKRLRSADNDCLQAAGGRLQQGYRC